MYVVTSFDQYQEKYIRIERITDVYKFFASQSHNSGKPGRNVVPQKFIFSSETFIHASIA